MKLYVRAAIDCGNGSDIRRALQRKNIDWKNPTGSGEVVVRDRIRCKSGSGRFEILDTAPDMTGKIYINDEPVLTFNVTKAMSDSKSEDYQRIARVCALKTARSMDFTPEEAKRAERDRKNREMARKIKNMSVAEVMDQYLDYGPSDRIVQSALRMMWHRFTDKDWANIYNWRIYKHQTGSESWASISVQGYGYTDTYDVTVDTGYNEYTERVLDSYGWHTE